MNTYEIYTTAHGDWAYVQAESTIQARNLVKVAFPEIHEAGYSLRKVG
jgi:hypothetical protein